MMELAGLNELVQWIEHGAVGREMRGGAWSYAAVEALHLIGIGLLFGSIVAFDLRLMGVSRSLGVGALARHNLRLAVLGFVLIVPTGLLMFTADATALARNPAFQLKLVLIMLAGINVLACHLGPLRALVATDAGQRPGAAAIATGAISLVLWIAVIVCGRMIAYV
jgi:hypothetical protein